ncbi:hypothetical protein JG687_00007515 [Phytophthora cactorum]|uniref:Uncharacterized protein n=1 Tax=Phytophthora cactorum TaxID=29920 RepID=A0A329S7R6_9STRA|nr:hypothetical protein PC116_g11127 [Phytophthora cactorum]KAG6961755.1 hypothetical protein JG687_00007515 [Phytophthora cactorum]RAW32963.1 hypothetical protein PC110_g10677 [Phytophthora cactorum]
MLAGCWVQALGGTPKCPWLRRFKIWLHVEWPTWPSDRSQLKRRFSLDDPRWDRPRPKMRQEGRRTLFAGLQTVSPARRRKGRKARLQNGVAARSKAMECHARGWKACWRVVSILEEVSCIWEVCGALLTFAAVFSVVFLSGS